MVGKLKRFAPLVMAGASLSACASFDGTIESTVSTQTKITEANAGNYGEASAPTHLKTLTTDADKKEFRNLYVRMHMRAHDAKYEDYKRRLSREMKGSGFGFETAILALTGIGSITTGNAPNYLSAAAAGLTGTKAALFREVYFQQTFPALMLDMDAKRLSAKTAILQKLRLKSIAEYPLSEAMMDLDSYETIGSLTEAMSEAVGKVTAEATADKAAATKAYENLIEVCTVEAETPKIWANIVAGLNALVPATDESKLDEVSDVLGTDKSGAFAEQKDAILTKLGTSYCSKSAAETLLSMLRLKTRLVLS